MPNRSSKGSAGEERIKLGSWGVRVTLSRMHTARSIEYSLCWSSWGWGCWEGREAEPCRCKTLGEIEIVEKKVEQRKKNSMKLNYISQYFYNIYFLSLPLSAGKRRGVKDSRREKRTQTRRSDSE